MMPESMTVTMWAVHAMRMAAHIALSARLGPVMTQLRKGLVPAVLAMVAFAPITHAHSQPGPVYAGAAAREIQNTAIVRDGISLDEAVRRAERQYHARVVRTDVQDEDGRKVYVLKLLSEDGRVFTVRVDASSGRGR
jgi:hypothetical protein